MTRTTYQFICVTAATLSVIGGCGESAVPVAEVEGMVTLDGQPLGDVQVEFLPELDRGTDAPRSTGRTDAQGKFKLVCDDQRAGALIGRHRIVVQDLKQLGLTIKPVDKFSEAYQAGDGPPSAQSRIPARYSEAARTPLRQEVKPEKQTVMIELSAR
jgi:hypothetical protein